MKKFIIQIALIISLLISVIIFSQSLPHTINYQGVLKNASGVVVTNGDYNLKFTIYEGEVAIWTEIKTITVTDGIFNTQLGSVTPIDLPFDNEYYLGITIGTESELTPRIRLSSVPYSYMSMNVPDGSITMSKIQNDQVVKSINSLKDNVNLVAGSNITITPSGNNLTISAAGGGSGTIGGSGTTNYIPIFTDNVTLGASALYQTGGNIGIGTTNPTAKFTIAGEDALINSLTIGKGANNINTNSAFGYHALYSSTTGYHNAAFGYASLLSNQTGNFNTASGVWSLRYNIDGISNTGFGYATLSNTTSGSLNTAIGSIALVSNTTGSSNTAAGFGALWSNIANNGNTAVGYYSMYYADNRTDGILTHNTAVGYQSLMGSNNAANNIGLYNTAIGSNALYQNLSGSGNTAIGYNSGNESTTNSYCTFVGTNSYSDIISGLENASGFGYDSRPTASNQVHIGNSSVTSIGGFANWTNFSDGRYKTAIQENVKGLDFILKLRPITYKLNINQLAADLKEDNIKDDIGNFVTNTSYNQIASRNEKSKIVYTGFIAQEVEQAALESGYNFSGVDAPKNDKDFYGLRYADFVVPLVKAIQEQQKIIEELTKRIEALERK